MKRKPILWFALAAGLLLTFAVVRAARQPATPRGEPASLSQPRLNTSPESATLPATDAVSTTFTYQGRLTDGGSPANGVYDFQFLLFDDLAAGNQVGTTVMLEDTSVSDGLFMVELNFGDVFDGRALWLEIRVRPGSEAGEYTLLSPRQALTATPYALGLRPGATVTGTATTGEAALNLINADGVGLQVSSIGNGVRVMYSADDAFQVEFSLNDGLSVGSAATAGVHVEQASTGVRIDSAGGTGVLVTEANGDGVRVDDAGGDGVHVAGAVGHGIYARSTSSTGYGGYFVNNDGGRGVYARGYESGLAQLPDLVLGGGFKGLLASDPSGASSNLEFVSQDDVLIWLDDDDGEDSIFGIYNGANQLVFSVDESGNITGPASNSAVVEAGANGPVKLHTMESPENWFEDFGTASLVAGKATVTIEPVFAATVNLEEDYHVFLTPLGDCALYVAEKTPTSFTVRALGGATCSIDFDYRVIAKRLGYEDLRLESADFSLEEE